MSFILLLYFVVIAEAAVIDNRVPTDSNNVCNTAACNEMGKSIHHNMNNLIDPCDDFYEYGCGSWATNNPLPPSELEYSVDTELSNKTYLRIKEVLEEDSEYDTLQPIKLLKQFYRSCMNEDAIKKRGFKDIKKLLNTTGGWPMMMLKESYKSNYTWQEIDNLYNRMFIGGSFFRINFIPDDQNSTRHILTLDQDFETFLEDELVKRNVEDVSVSKVKKLTKVLVAFVKDEGTKLTLQDLKKDIMDVLSFEDDLDNITEEEKELQKSSKKNETRMTITELQEYYDSATTENSTAKINWLDTIQNMFNDSDVNINASDPIIVYNKHLLHKLAHLLDKTPPRVIVNYLHWYVVNEFLPYLNKEIQDIIFEDRRSRYNITEQKPRWYTCIENIPMKDAVSFLFVKKYMPIDTVNGVKEIVEDIKTEMKERILQSKWSNDTKDFMIAKIDNINEQIGYPKWYNNQTALIEHYKGLEFGDDYFDNFMTFIVYETKQSLSTFSKPVDRNEWLDYPITNNAFYSAQYNTMVIPAAEIQDPYFTTGMPLAINYGTVGYTVGHELSHSFDTDGIKYDKIGNRRLHANDTNAAYMERVKCFVDQYSNFNLTVPKSKDEDEDEDEDEPVKLDGQLTKDENIADNVGLDIAFAAFQKRKQLMGPQPKLPGLENRSDEELFYLSYVHAWCTVQNAKYEKASLNDDTHSPPKFRILGVMANMVSFAEAFNCSMGSPLNPESKCNLWK